MKKKPNIRTYRDLKREKNRLKGHILATQDAMKKDVQLTRAMLFHRFTNSFHWLFSIVDIAVLSSGAVRRAKSGSNDRYGQPLLKWVLLGLDLFHHIDALRKQKGPNDRF